MAATGPELVTPGGEDAGLPPATDHRADVKIEYSAQLVEKIRADTVSAFLSIPYGGVEIAGVLLGSRKGRMIYLAAARPIECRHEAGPSFILSAQDEWHLESLLAHSRNDPELEGLEILGWYVSHTRRPTHPTPSEIELLERLFPGPLQLIGVVRPEATGVAQFRWFVRDEDGYLDPERASFEFTVQPSISGPRSEPELFKSETERRLPRHLPHRAMMATKLPPPEFEPPRRVRLPHLALAMTGLMLLMMALCTLWWFRARPAQDSPVPLHVLDNGKQLRLDWDVRSPVVQRARLGMLEIKDAYGKPVRMNLSSDIIRTGSVLFNKPSNKVEIALQLADDNGKMTTSMVYFIGPEQVAIEVKPEISETSAMAIEEPPRKPEPLHKPEPRPEVPPVTTGSAERAKATFRPPVAKRVAAAVEPPLLEPPKITAAPTLPQRPGLPLPVASVHSADPSPSIPTTEAPRARPQPTSGRLIWTGELRKNAVLRVTEQGASSGSLNGKLPAQPLKITARPAELLDGAIAVYTSDPNANTKAEAPGRLNGWNVTMYKFDPKHAHDLSIVEMPSESNQWKLGIKSQNRAVSMIVIDWRLATN